MAKKKTSKKTTSKHKEVEIPKPIFVEIENIKYCPRCGNQAIMQHPPDMKNHILTCGHCDIQFQIVIGNFIIN